MNYGCGAAQTGSRTATPMVQENLAGSAKWREFPTTKPLPATPNPMASLKDLCRSRSSAQPPRFAKRGYRTPYWHWALLYHETAWNITEHKGRAVKIPWEAIFGEAFIGHRIPFGAEIKFVPPPASRHWTDKLPFGRRAIHGIFLGWEMDACCKFRGKYRVAALEDFDDIPPRESSATSSRRVYSTITTNIAWPAHIDASTRWRFPLSARYQLENEDGIGRVSSAAPGHREAQQGGQPGSHMGFVTCL